MKSQVPRCQSPVYTGACMALLCIIMSLRAAPEQSFGRVEQTQSNIDSYHYFVDPGTPTIQISVMGPVRYPGVYELSKGSDLKRALALSGGPDQGRVEFVNKQRTTVRLYRPSGGTQKPIYESLLDKAVTGPEASPMLAEGDVIVFEVAAWRRFDWRDVLTIVNVVNTVVLIFLAAGNL